MISRSVSRPRSGRKSKSPTNSKKIQERAKSIPPHRFSSGFRKKESSIKRAGKKSSPRPPRVGKRKHKKGKTAVSILHIGKVNKKKKGSVLRKRHFRKDSGDLILGIITTKQERPTSVRVVKNIRRDSGNIVSPSNERAKLRPKTREERKRFGEEEKLQSVRISLERRRSYPHIITNQGHFSRIEKKVSKRVYADEKMRIGTTTINKLFVRRPSIKVFERKNKTSHNPPSLGRRCGYIFKEKKLRNSCRRLLDSPIPSVKKARRKRKIEKDNDKLVGTKFWNDKRKDEKTEEKGKKQYQRSKNYMSRNHPFVNFKKLIIRPSVVSSWGTRSSTNYNIISTRPYAN